MGTTVGHFSRTLTQGAKFFSSSFSSSSSSSSSPPLPSFLIDRRRQMEKGRAGKFPGKIPTVSPSDRSLFSPSVLQSLCLSVSWFVCPSVGRSFVQYICFILITPSLSSFERLFFVTGNATYKSLCRSVGSSIRRSVHPTLLFRRF